MTIPKNYQTVMPYIIVEGAADFMTFMQNVFGATEKMKMMRDEKIIMHAEVMIDGSTIMFAESIPNSPPTPASLFVYVDDVDAAYQKAISNGAQTIESISEKDYGRACGVKDSFGNTWWITSPANFT